MARLPKRQDPEEPQQEPERKAPDPSDIDARMAALRKDHIAMGARRPDDPYIPRQ